MIEMLITDLDGTLADWLLRLAGPDSLRHRLFVVDGDICLGIPSNYGFAIFCIHILLKKVYNAILRVTVVGRT